MLSISCHPLPDFLGVAIHRALDDGTGAASEGHGCRGPEPGQCRGCVCGVQHVGSGHQEARSPAFAQQASMLADREEFGAALDLTGLMPSTQVNLISLIPQSLAL